MKRRDLVKWIWETKDNDELAERYDQWATTYDSDLEEAFGWIGPQSSAAVFSRLVPKNARVLDAGAGTGLVGQALAKYGYTDIVAADLSRGMLKAAQKKNVYREFHQVVLGEALVFAGDSFDAVVSVGVLTLGHAPPDAFDELIRVTRPGGYIVFTLKTDVYEKNGFKEKQKLLERQKKWVFQTVGQPFKPLPKGEPDVFHQVWAYRVI